MKTKIPYALLGAILSVSAPAATTTPVGYETLELTPGSFNYLGLRLHQPTLFSGTLETAGSSSVQDEGADYSGITANASQLYILEIEDGSGIIAEFLGSDVSGDTISLVDDLSAAGVSSGASYSIRPAATLNSVFGESNSAGLSTGFFGPGGADVVYLPDGSGSFDQYYYDEGATSWANARTGSAVDGSQIGINYADGVIISATADAPSSIVITGEVKTSSTLLALQSGFNYTSPVAPAGATLAASFDVSELSQGFFGPGGADIVYVPSDSGFDQYYYDSGAESWANASTSNTVDASTVDLPAGVIVSNSGDSKPISLLVPSSYSSL